MQDKYKTTTDALQKMRADLQYKIRSSRVNRQNKEAYTEKIAQLNGGIAGMEVLRTYLKPMIEDLTAYLSERKKKSLQTINGAIRMSGEIVPNAMPNVVLEVKDGEAWLATTDGLIVKLIEGDGFKSILSAFLQTVTLSANPDYLQTIFFDERFAKVSVEHSTVLSTFLNVLTQTMQVISIEQKPEVYMNANHIEYRFEKQGDYSMITKEEHTNVEGIQAE